MMKRFGAMILLVAMLLSLCACGKAEKELFGTWRTEYDFSETMEEQLVSALGLEDASIDAALIVPFELTLNEDHTCKLAIDTEATTASFTTYMDALIDFIVEETYKQGEAAGATREQIDEQFASMGGDLKSYMQSMLSTETLEDQLLADYEEQTGVWKAEDNKLFIEVADEYFSADSYIEYTLEGDTLTFKSANDDGFDFAEIMSDSGLVFYKK